jgi:membrane associated rhomboid family serine protease
MFPVNVMRRNTVTPYVTVLLIVVNLIIFLWETTLGPRQLYTVFYEMSLVPCKVASLPLPNTLLASLFSMFLHGGWVHLLGNMAFLIVFGPHVEEYFGHRNYVLVYLVFGFGSALLHTILSWGQCIPVVGASGAIFGVMGAFLLLYPSARVQFLSIMFRIIPMGLVALRAWVAIGLYFAINLLSGLFDLAGMGNTMDGVAVWGHIGGFLTGLVVVFLFTMFKPAPAVDYE